LDGSPYGYLALYIVPSVPDRASIQQGLARTIFSEHNNMPTDLRDTHAIKQPQPRASN
jgi:hypothetical protein